MSPSSECDDSYNPSVSYLAIRLQKVIAAVRQPRYRRAFISQRVLPTVELKPLLGGTFSTVLDVGANRGQFALVARETWPTARIVSFEPAPRAAAAFQSLFANEQNVELHMIALGATHEARVLTIPHDDDGASFLVPLSGEQLAVEVRRLDDINLNLQHPVLLKLDVQGFELEVLKGATVTLQNVDAIVAECSFSPAPPVPSAAELIEFATAAGFVLVGAIGNGEFGDLRFDRKR